MSVAVPAIRFVCVCVCVIVLGRVDPEHVRTQRDAQRGTLVLTHHGQIELDLFNPGYGSGHPVHFVGQLIGTGPGGDGKGELDPDPATPRLHLSQHTHGAKREAELGIHYRTERHAEL
jgi:hypothetical protein